MINIILQSIGLDNVNNTVHAKYHENITNGIRVIKISTRYASVSKCIRAVR